MGSAGPSVNFGAPRDLGSTSVILSIDNKQFKSFMIDFRMAALPLALASLPPTPVVFAKKGASD